jgi:hypothetical protein
MKNSEIILYTTPQGHVKVEVLVREETVWRTINKMAELFGATKQNISYHLQNIFNENELDKKATVKEILTVQTEGQRQVSHNLEYYNLDAKISVGYRVNTSRATQFRIWATHVLREFITKGFALDDERLKQGGTLFGKDYFDELLERIREIRASERRFYQKITDIYAQCSIDYDPQAEITQLFYQTVQNKLHWTMTVYLDFAELQAERQIPMKMQEWAERLDAFLQFNQYDVLNNPGQVSVADTIEYLVTSEPGKFSRYLK